MTLRKPCVLWTGAKNKKINGYGCFRRNGRRVLAHRDAYEKRYGAIPEGMKVLHRCDVKLCIEPTHLRLGTVADNNREARERGLWRPEHHPRKLTVKQVKTIRRRRANGELLRTLAAEYGVSLVMISRITHRKTWTHV